MTSTIGGGTITGAVGTAQTSTSSTAASSTYSFSPKANGTSLTYTPTAAFVGTIAVTAKQILPITAYSYVGKDSTGAVSTQFLRQTLGSAHNDFGDNSGAYCTTCTTNTNSGYVGQYSLTTGSSNTNSGFYGQYNLTTGSNNTNSGNQGQYSLTTGGNNTNSGYDGQYNLTTGNYNTNSGNQGQYSLTTGNYNTSSGYQAGRYIANGSTPNQTSSNSLYDGYETYAKVDGDTNENVIGNAAIGAGSNTTVLGNASITDTWLGGSGGASNNHAKDFVPTSSTPGISGCSSASVVGNDHYGVITAGGVSCNAVLTFSYSALNGWSCVVNNQTHPGATNLVGEASSTTNSATFAGTTVTSDKINYVCGPY